MKKWSIVAAALTALIAAIFGVIKLEGNKPSIDSSGVVTVEDGVIVSSTPVASTPTPATPTPVVEVPPTVPPTQANTEVKPYYMEKQPEGFYRSTRLGVSGGKLDNECYVQTRLKTAPKAGSTVVIERKVRTNYVYKIGQNVKDERHYRAGEQYSNFYASYDTAASRKLTIETGDGDKSAGDVQYSYRSPTRWNIAFADEPLTNRWYTVKTTIKFATSNTAADGKMQREICDENGKNCRVVFKEQSGLMTGDPWTDYGSQLVLANANGDNKFPAGTVYEAYPPVVTVWP